MLKIVPHINTSSMDQTTLRVWDVIFNEGAKVIFNVALAIFKVPLAQPFCSLLDFFGLIMFLSLNYKAILIFVTVSNFDHVMVNLNCR